MYDSDNPISRLPDSILSEILSKLPAKFIHQLKCISNRWFSLISNPNFAQFYMSRFSDSPEFTIFFRSLVNPNPNPYFSNFNSNFVSIKIENFGNGGLFSALIINGLHPKPVEIVGFCDGLLLCSDARNLVYYLCNPITGDIVLIKPSPYPCYSVGCGLICKLGVGFIEFYCLVLIQRFLDSVDTLNLQVYLSEIDEWRVVEVNCPGKLSRVFSEYSLSPAIPYKGMLHWVHVAHGLIIVYDPFGEPNRCRFIELPGEKRRYGFNGVCNVCEGRLRFFEVDSSSLERHTFPGVHVWVLDDYEQGKWVLERDVTRSVYCVDGDLRRGMSSMPYMCLMPLFVHPLDKDTIFFWCAFCVLSYNVESKILAIEVENYVDKLLYYKDVFPIVFPPWPMPIP